MKKKSRKIIALIFAVAMLFSVNSSAISTLQDNPAIYYENTNFFPAAASAEAASSAARNTQTSWATFSINETMTAAELQVSLNGYLYDFTAYGSAQEAGTGYVGLYQGYIVPDINDTVLRPHLQTGAPGVLVSVDAVFSGEEIFFTLVIGVISETQDPIVKAYGTHTDSINSIARVHAENTEILTTQEAVLPELPAAATARASSVDATIKYQIHGTIYDSNLNSLGQISLFNADELGNQDDTPFYMRVNTNRNNANTYARNYFGLTDNDISTAYPTKVQMAFLSTDDLLTIETNGYSPQTSSQSIQIPIYIWDPLVNKFTSLLQLIDGVEVPVTQDVSSVEATTSNIGQYAPKEINWILRHTAGFTGTDGDYTSGKGICTEARYRYDGSISDPVDKVVKGSTSITYTIYVEDSVYGTLHTYTFTTATKTCLTSITVIP